MALKKLEENKIEVDMVPLIDIITLLLMFLVIVGDMASQANAIQMKLPRASEAMTDKDLKEKRGVRMEGRIVVQLKADNGKYMAVINNKSYELVERGGNKTLLEYLSQQVDYQLAKEMAKKDATGAVDIPVKLRIPEEAPMLDVENVVMTLARVGLVNVQYAAEPTFK
jgi:biopolymer transport protein ExbD